MMLKRTACLLIQLSFGLGFSSTQAGEVSLRLSGVAFEGGPSFEAVIGDNIIGTGTVEQPVADGETFSFDVADDILAARGNLVVRLTNDYFVSESQDRSLTVLGASVGSTVLAPGDFSIMRDGTILERDSSAGTLVWSGDEAAVAEAPAGGWLPVDGQLAQGNEPLCSEFAEVLDFRRGSASTGDLSLEGLSPILAAAQNGACSVTITGFADISGTELTNLRLTAARSSAVLDDLLLRGARFPTVSIVPTTGTSDFGADDQANRRVNIQLWKPATPSAITSSSPASQTAVEAQQAELAQILVLGWRSNGELYVRSSNTDPKEALWLLEQAKARIIAGEPVLGVGQ